MTKSDCIDGIKEQPVRKIPPEEAIIVSNKGRIEVAGKMGILYGTLTNLLKGRQYWTKKYRKSFCKAISMPDENIAWDLVKKEEYVRAGDGSSNI